jgi:PAS domain S-box-containing protein
VNPAWCRLLGYSTSEIVSLTFDQITHPDDWPQDLPDLRQRDPGKLDSYRLQKRYFKKNGELMWANLTVTVLREQEGLPRFTLAMIEDITERKQAEELIQASLLEKETLLKEIHHRVKNNLQIISSLLRLQSRQIQDQQTLELFKESQNRVQAMALIHEKLYQSSNLAQIDFQEYITTLVEHLCRSYDIHQPAITIKINVEPVPLPIDTAIPCGLIINELVSNSLKYAFPGNQGGEICLKLQFGASSCNAPVDTEQFILTVRDNGIGLPENLDFRNTSSLGLQLVCRLAKQIRGSLELNRRQGTEFNLVFAS